jgi:hypothetical protein
MYEDGNLVSSAAVVEVQLKIRITVANGIDRTRFVRLLCPLLRFLSVLNMITALHKQPTHLPCEILASRQLLLLLRYMYFVVCPDLQQPLQLPPEQQHVVGLRVPGKRQSVPVHAASDGGSRRLLHASPLVDVKHRVSSYLLQHHIG